MALLKFAYRIHDVKRFVKLDCPQSWISTIFYLILEKNQVFPLTKIVKSAILASSFKGLSKIVTRQRAMMGALCNTHPPFSTFHHARCLPTGRTILFQKEPMPARKATLRRCWRASPQTIEPNVVYGQTWMGATPMPVVPRTRVAPSPSGYDACE